MTGYEIRKNKYDLYQRDERIRTLIKEFLFQNSILFENSESTFFIDGYNLYITTMKLCTSSTLVTQGLKNVELFLKNEYLDNNYKTIEDITKSLNFQPNFLEYLDHVVLKNLEVSKLIKEGKINYN